MLSDSFRSEMVWAFLSYSVLRLLSGLLFDGFSTVLAHALLLSWLVPLEFLTLWLLLRRHLSQAIQSRVEHNWLLGDLNDVEPEMQTVPKGFVLLPVGHLFRYSTFRGFCSPSLLLLLPLSVNAAYGGFTPSAAASELTRLSSEVPTMPEAISATSIVRKTQAPKPFLDTTTIRELLSTLALIGVITFRMVIITLDKNKGLVENAEIYSPLGPTRGGGMFK